MKKIISITLIVCSLFSFVTLAKASTSNDVTVVLDGEILNFDVPAQIIDGRTMVPMRLIFEKLGAEIEWDPVYQTITAESLGIHIRMEINNTQMYRNMIPYELDVPPVIINSRALVPLRAVSNCMGANVVWDDALKTAYIHSTDKINYINWSDKYYYYGETENGEANGLGILYFKADNAIRRIGMFENSVFVMGGDFWYGDSSTADDNEFFLGIFENSERFKGSLYAPNGDRYDGYFKDNKFNGEGIYYYANGDFCGGYWIDGMIEGEGVYYSAEEGTYLYGSFINGNLHGKTTFTDSEGNIIGYPIFQNGILIG
ncbi:MAG: hypothetical protein IJ300_05945 [Clostridia bacterium]|nr:hypothetical protein [Clostridia bacterium]